MPERYTDGYGHDELPLFRKGRDKQIEDMAKFVDEFDGKHYEGKTDKERLARQIKGVHDHISSGAWKTVEEISMATGYPQPSVSAQLRNLRKERFGGLDVQGRYRSGTWLSSLRALQIGIDLKLYTRTSLKFTLNFAVSQRL